MHGEAPELRRCCFCLPLRRGLITWGYAKLILNLLTFAYVIAMTIWFTRRFGDFDPREIAILTAIVTALLIDLPFGIIFIVACHKKSVKLLHISYIYNVVWLGLMLIGNCFQLYMSLKFIYRIWNYFEYRMYIIMDLLLFAGLAFSVLFVQIYLILLLRSEMAKLRSQSLEMQFSNHLHSNEPQCTLHNATAGQCEGKKQFVQAGCSVEKQDVQDCCTGKKQVCCTDK